MNASMATHTKSVMSASSKPETFIHLPVSERTDIMADITQILCAPFHHVTIKKK